MDSAENLLPGWKPALASENSRSLMMPLPSWSIVVTSAATSTSESAWILRPVPDGRAPVEGPIDVE
jgi:hypothetical protein